jgi:hypothetical protein
MAVLYVAATAVGIGLATVFLLSLFSSTPKARCGIIIASRRHYNICVKYSGHKDMHETADGREF